MRPGLDSSSPIDLGGMSFPRLIPPRQSEKAVSVQRVMVEADGSVASSGREATDPRWEQSTQIDGLKGHL